MTDRQKQIVAEWNRVDEDDPDISTEMLMHMTETNCEASTEEVCEALWLDEERRNGVEK